MKKISSFMLTKCSMVLCPVGFIFLGIVLCRGRPLVPPNLSWSFSCKEKFTAKPAGSLLKWKRDIQQRIKELWERKVFFTGRLHDSRNVGILALSKKHWNDILYMTIRRIHAEMEIFNCLWPISQAFYISYLTIYVSLQVYTSMYSASDLN